MFAWRNLASYFGAVCTAGARKLVAAAARLIIPASNGQISD